MKETVISLLWLAAVPFALAADAPVLQSWSGDFPVAKLDLLPEGQRGNGQGFFDDPEAFELLWEAFQPKEPVPEVDFENHLVVFSRNITFYNRTRIGSLRLVEEGVLEISGEINGKQHDLRLHQREIDEFPMRARGFNWINENPYNRG